MVKYMLCSWNSQACQPRCASWYHWSQNEACLLCIQRFAFLWMWIIPDANIYLLEKKKQKIFEMNACGALAAVSVRVLGCYLGLKYIQWGTQGRCSWIGGGWRSLCKEKLRADKCLKRWLNVICWHLPTVGPRCFKHGRAAIQHIFNQCQGRGEKWLNTVFSKGHRPLFQRLGATAHEPQISQLFLPAAPLAWRKNITNKRKLTPTQIKWTQQLIHPLCRIFV